MAISDEMLGQFSRLEPAEPKRITRSIPLENNMVMDQTSHDGGMTWTDVGESYSRFKPDRETGESFTGESFSGFKEEERSIISKAQSLMEAGSTPREIMDWISRLPVPHRLVEKLVPIIFKMFDLGGSGEALMSPAEGQFGGSPHSGGPFWRQYNQGGIVSLRHLTRPLGI